MRRADSLFKLAAIMITHPDESMTVPSPKDTPADRWPDDSPEREEANRILREERFRLLVQGVNDYAIFLLDAEGRVICWKTGAERIFG
jgi:PAS domain-containing protein